MGFDKKLRLLFIFIIIVISQKHNIGFFKQTINRALQEWRTRAKNQRHLQNAKIEQMSAIDSYITGHGIYSASLKHNLGDAIPL